MFIVRYHCIVIVDGALDSRIMHSQKRQAWRKDQEREYILRKDKKSRKKGIRVRKEKKRNAVWSSEKLLEKRIDEYEEEKRKKKKEKKKRRGVSVHRVAEAVMWIDGWRSVRRRQEQRGRLEGRE